MSSSSSKAAQRWDEAHSVGKPSGEERSSASSKKSLPTQLYTDENPATTIKGTGFKNRRIAQRTIELTGQPGARYKQYWTIRAMRERAAHHPHPTEGIREAIAVFDEWLSDYDEPTEEERQKQRKEWEEFRRLCESDANQHAYGKNATEQLELKRARQDIAEGNRLLFELLHICRPNKESSSICFPLTCFVAVFGGPGLHGYGKHTIDEGDCTSQIDIAGMSGVEELLGTAKSSKLPIVSAMMKIEVKYHRKQERAKATIKPTGTDYTLKGFWSRSGIKLNDPSDKKRKREEQHREDVPHDAKKAGGDCWTCSACTFIHTGKAKLYYLACEVCGSQRSDKHQG